MTPSGFWRIFWKEYRTLRGFWIAMAVLGLLVQFYFFVMMEQGLDAVPTLLFGIALGVPAFHALGCAAVTFSMEREQETHDTLRAMSMRWTDLFFGKMAFAVFSAIAMMLVLLPVGAALSALEPSWRWPSHEARMNLAALWGVGVFEAVAWGALFSLTLASPMRAAVLGAAAAVFSAQAWASTGSTSASFLAEAESYSVVVPHRLATSAIILIADLVLARFWMGAWGDARKHPLRAEEAGVELRARDQRPTSIEPRRGQIMRLVWQDFKQNKLLFLTFAGISALVAIWSALDAPRSVLAWFPLAFTIPGLVMAANTFLTDQTNRQFRYFANIGVRPRTVWLSRQIAMLLRAAALMVLIAGLFVGTLYFTGHLSAPPQPIMNSWKREDYLLAASLAISTFAAPLAIGQLASLLLRSQIVAVVGAAGTSLLFVFFSSVMSRLGVNLWWSAPPVLALFFLVSWLRTPDWMLERGGWRPWAKVGAAFFAPLLIFTVSVMFYRVYEIPKIDPGFSPHEFAAKMEMRSREKAALYEQAARLVTPDPELIPAHLSGAKAKVATRTDWVRENQEAIDVALQALAIPGPPYRDPFQYGVKRRAYSSYQLEKLFAESASELAQNGDFAGSIERGFATVQLARDLSFDSSTSYSQVYHGEINIYYQLIDRAKRPSMTTSEIRGLINRLEELDDTTPDFSEEIKSAHLTAMRLLKLWKEKPTDFFSEAGIGYRRDVYWVTGIGFLPTEHFRAERLANALTNYLLKIAENTASDARLGKPSRMPSSAQPIDGVHPPELLRAARTSPLSGGNLRALPLNEHVFYRFTQGLENWRLTKTANRKVRLTLALVAWKKDHNGKLPDDLKQLEGEYIDKIPLSLYTGTPFQLQRRGPDIPATPADESKLPDFVWDPRNDVTGWHYDGISIP